MILQSSATFTHSRPLCCCPRQKRRHHVSTGYRRCVNRAGSPATASTSSASQAQVCAPNTVLVCRPGTSPQPDVICRSSESCVWYSSHQNSHLQDVDAAEEQRVKQVRMAVTRRIKDLGRAGKAREAVQQLAEMARLGVQPDSMLGTALVDACARSGHMQMAQAAFEELFGVSPSSFLAA